ncbi:MULTISPECIES: hypothetical protein [Burkholderia]|uniref:hypothetical protein n=1 Tax=Burkholderia TaxID=32008 RepID=UPI0010470453|nr:MULTISPECIES: hypothetical protein [Burkholderia]
MIAHGAPNAQRISSFPVITTSAMKRLSQSDSSIMQSEGGTPDGGAHRLKVRSSCGKPMESRPLPVDVVDAAAPPPAARTAARPCKGFAIIPAPCLAESDMPARSGPPLPAVNRTSSLAEEQRRPICLPVRERDPTSAASTC